MNTATSAWHAGERALQQRAGVDARMAEIGPRFLRDYMPDQHREFFALLPWLLACTLDASGQPRVSMLSGPPGFVHSPDPRVLRIEAALEAQLAVSDPVALLGLQAHTGRRNRMNGRIAAIEAGAFEVAVGQSFGNCPKYIHPREALYEEGNASPALTQVLSELDTEALRLVQAADTFFIATAHPQARTAKDPSAGLDVSHRGGPAGFVQVGEDGGLLVPDYVGNSFFNTFGNLQLEPRCALLFVDWTTGERLELMARAEVLWEGAARMMRMEVVQATRTTGGLPLRWIER